MNAEDARKAICARWTTSWAATTPYVFENENNKTLDAGTVPWARVYVRHVGGGQETLGPEGGRKYERRGTVLVHLYTTSDSGMKRSDVLAYAARAIFEGVSFSAIDFTNGQIREIGPDGKWYLTAVEINFTYYEIK